MSQTFIVVLVRFLTGVRAYWKGCSPSSTQRIYFANHTSNLDAVVVWAALPRELRAQTRPVAAQDYWLGSFIRRYLAQRVFKAVLIERKKVTVKSNPLTPMLAALEEGSSLIIFPEGGRMSGDHLGEFKSGIYHLAAHRPDVELVPTWIDNVNRVLPKGEILPVPFLGSVTMGEPLKVGADESKEQFLCRARAAVESLRPPA